MTEKQCKKLSELHRSVLLDELVENINVHNSLKNIIVDCTLGMGGHATEVIKKMNSGDIFIGFDADYRNLEIVKPHLEKIALENNVKIFFVNDNFNNLKINLEKIGINEITGIYYDFGLSSLHVDEAQRGFSFRFDGPLDMRFDETKGITAAQIINSYSKDDLFKIFKEYGEEPSSRKLSQKIFDLRKTGFRFKTTKDLVEVISQVTTFPKAKTKIFQALRIETNQELEVIKNSMKEAISLLKSGGSIFAISFHSLEDRIVKNIFRDESRDCICSEIVCVCNHKKQIIIKTKKPIEPSEKEIRENTRSRSAKARFAVKI
ncbi:MAG: 16S rRNA (cytosine(1402)-N(4))-methyltransferase RsmH [Candidatus Gracilibacteria bacterium]|nr:16S rRNA (cytosine(1402)-N(4))-methyltransferase RsmH [Candidatus Gracilibacteria bacterium]